MGKVPHIERAYGGVALTGECAYLWAVFLANEADMADDIVNYDKFKAMAEQLAPKAGFPVAASVHYPALEEEISKYYNAREYINPANCPQE